jgi:alkylation response protein AidB-like acyl-CoA dehydrogenase
MNFQLSDQQVLLREQFGKLFRQESTPARIRAAEPLGFDSTLWTQLVAFGAPAMRVPEALGGGGIGLLDAVVVMEEAGRHLLSAPLAEVLVAAGMLAALGGDTALSWLERIVEDGAVVTILPYAAQQDAMPVPAASVADAMLWLDRDAVRLTPLAPPTERANYHGSLPFADVALDRVDSVVLARGEAAVHAFQAAIEEWKLLTGALLVGSAEQALLLAATYAGERSAFGKPIGSFQGVAHPLADSVTDIDGARLLLWRAVWEIAQGRRDAAATVSLAAWFAGRAANRAVTRAMRAFGGYGMTMEYDIQLHFRRTRGWMLAGGDPAEELRRAGDRLFGDTRVALPVAGETGMDFSWGEAAERLGNEVRQFFAENLGEVHAGFAYGSDDAHDPALFQKLAAARLLYPEWPEAYGGRGCNGAESAAVQEAFNECGVPILVPVVTDMVGKMVLAAGTGAAQRELLPELAAGRAYCSLGYSEPSGGSDVFAAKTRAVRDGDEWIINGQKMFTTQGHLADYALLLARTDPTLAKHAGLTLFVVPLRQKGYESQHVRTIGDERTNITFYTDMRVPDRYRLGEVNGGAKAMSAALNLEQGVGLYNVGPLRRVFEHAQAWACGKAKGNARAIDLPEVRARLASVQAHILVADALTRRSIWAGESGQSQKWYGSMSKLFGSEAWLSCTSDLMEMAAPETLRVEQSDTGWIEMEYRRALPSTIYGGTSEIHRSIIAESALKMPRSRT